MQLDYSYVNTGRSLHFNQIFVQHWESTYIFRLWLPTPEKSFFWLWLRLPVKTLDSLDSDSRLCSTNLNNGQYHFLEQRPTQAVAMATIMSYFVQKPWSRAVDPLFLFASRFQHCRTTQHWILPKLSGFPLWYTSCCTNGRKGVKIAMVLWRHFCDSDVLCQQGNELICGKFNAESCDSVETWNRSANGMKGQNRLAMVLWRHCCHIATACAAMATIAFVENLMLSHGGVTGE